MVFTGDIPAVQRRGLAVEPMTCPPNAFRTGEALVTLEPGESHTATWGLVADDRGRRLSRLESVRYEMPSASSSLAIVAASTSVTPPFASATKAPIPSTSSR